MSYVLSTQGIRIEQEPASFAARLLAFVIDISIMVLMLWGLIELADAMERLGVESVINESFMYFLVFFIPYLYPLLCEALADGQTVGKRLLHTRVVALDGGGPKLTSLLLRWLLLPFDVFWSFGIGPLCVFFTKHQQRLGDVVAGTWVVRTQEYRKASF